jgi:hypothetical protein
MRKPFGVSVKVAMAALIAVALMAGPAYGQTTITWTGQGSENLPCPGGAHWVLTGKGITSATLTVNGVTYPMTQSGQGSWSADSTTPLDDDPPPTASATYTGNPRNPQLVLSHCLGYPPVVAGEVVVQGGAVKGGAVEAKPAKPAVAGAQVAFTGAELAALFVVLGGLFAGGIALVVAGRRRAAKTG